VRAWDPKWDNSDRETTKIVTTTLNVLLTLPGAKLKMRWLLNSKRKRSKTSKSLIALRTIPKMSVFGSTRSLQTTTTRSNRSYVQ
jgi:hypothetical protein